MSHQAQCTGRMAYLTRVRGFFFALLSTSSTFFLFAADDEGGETLAGCTSALTMADVEEQRKLHCEQTGPYPNLKCRPGNAHAIPRRRAVHRPRLLCAMNIEQP